MTRAVPSNRETISSHAEKNKPGSNEYFDSLCYLPAYLPSYCAYLQGCLFMLTIQVLQPSIVKRNLSPGHDVIKQMLRRTTYVRTMRMITLTIASLSSSPHQFVSYISMSEIILAAVLRTSNLRSIHLGLRPQTSN